MTLHEFLSDLIVCPMCSDLLKNDCNSSGSLCPNGDCAYLFRRYGQQDAYKNNVIFKIYLSNYMLWIYHDQFLLQPLKTSKTTPAYIPVDLTTISIHDFQSPTSLNNKINLLLAFQ